MPPQDIFQPATVQAGPPSLASAHAAALEMDHAAALLGFLQTRTPRRIVLEIDMGDDVANFRVEAPVDVATLIAAIQQRHTNLTNTVQTALTGFATATTSTVGA